MKRKELYKQKLIKFIGLFYKFFDSHKIEFMFISNLILLFLVLGMISLFGYFYLKFSLIKMGFEYLENKYTFLVFSLFIIIFLYYILDKFVKGKYSKMINIWVILTTFLFFILLFQSLNFLVYVYPGENELNKVYSPEFWPIDYSEEFKDKISGLRVWDAYDLKENYFIENSAIYGAIFFKDPNYDYKIYLNKGLGEEEIYETNKNGSAYFHFNVTKSRLYHFEISAANKLFGEKRVVIFNIYPNVMTSSEAEDKKRNSLLILGSLMSAILIISVTIMNQIRQIWNNTK